MADEKSIYDSIDPEIREVVRQLRDKGWNTTYSCQGGEGHQETQPTVELDLFNAEDAERLATTLAEMGHRTFAIDISLQVPGDGFWVRRARIVLGEWVISNSSAITVVRSELRQLKAEHKATLTDRELLIADLDAAQAALDKMSERMKKILGIVNREIRGYPDELFYKLDEIARLAEGKE